MLNDTIHPLADAVRTIRGALESVADVNTLYASPDVKEAALIELITIESLTTELRLRVMLDSLDVAQKNGSRDIADWLASSTHIRKATAHTELTRARALDTRPHLASAVRLGQVNMAQAEVILKALANLPASIPAEVVDDAETFLIDAAKTMDPTDLAKCGKKILHVVAPEIADAAEAKALEDQERRAREKTKLTINSLNDGTCRVSARIPIAVAALLNTILTSYTNPRRNIEDD